MLSKKNQNTGEAKQLNLLARRRRHHLTAAVVCPGRRNSRARRSNPPGSRSQRSGRGIPQITAVLGDQARLMGLPLAAGSPAFWYLARAGGIVSYLLLWLATCWGILMSSKFFKGRGIVPVTFALHEFLPIMGVVFAALHAAVLLGDTYIGFSVWQLLVPFTSTYKPFWTGLGSLAFYLFLALLVSFYVRKQMGQKVWRAFHYTAYLAFVIALLHGLMAGSDSGSLTMRALYLATGGVSLFLVYYRTLSYTPRNSRARPSRLPGTAADAAESQAGNSR